MKFETTKNIVLDKLKNVEVVSLNKKIMDSDNIKNQLQSSPSIEELRKKFLSEITPDDVPQPANQSADEAGEIGVIKIRSKDQGDDSSESSGERTVIVKDNDILGAQG